MSIDYDHNANFHTIAGAEAALPHIFAPQWPKSVLDVGCGTGTWIHAALRSGISDIFGLDGIDINQERLLFPRKLFRQQDLTQKWELGRKFDVVFCLEVAEHLPAESGQTLIQALVTHSDAVVFSAACPGQLGQHHINCQWPEYWQHLFNTRGYVCDDSVRWKIWDLELVEPWYRQNIFIASRSTHLAGQEPRIKSVVHPQMLAGRGFEVFHDEKQLCLAGVESGDQSAWWYLITPLRAYRAKLLRRINNVLSQTYLRTSSSKKVAQGR
jgi:SAM-dependent methyltransferase